MRICRRLRRGVQGFSLEKQGIPPHSLTGGSDCTLPLRLVKPRETKGGGEWDESLSDENCPSCLRCALGRLRAAQGGTQAPLPIKRGSRSGCGPTPDGNRSRPVASPCP